MGIAIVWPEQRTVPDEQIELWFVEALARGWIHPADCGAKTPQKMAAALDNAGVILLQAQDTSDTTNNE